MINTPLCWSPAASHSKHPPHDNMFMLLKNLGSAEYGVPPYKNKAAIFVSLLSGNVLRKLSENVSSRTGEDRSGQSSVGASPELLPDSRHVRKKSKNFKFCFVLFFHGGFCGKITKATSTYLQEFRQKEQRGIKPELNGAGSCWCGVFFFVFFF